MESGPESGSQSEAQPQTQAQAQPKPNGGWLSRIPLWVRIVVPVVVLAALVVAVIVGVSATSTSGDEEDVAEALHRRGIEVATGRFGAHMAVRSDNDGPVTIVLDSEHR